MARYYGLVSGLIDLSVDAQKLPLSQEEFYLELQDILSNKDRELLEWLHQEQSHAELLRLIGDGSIAPAPASTDGEEDNDEEEDNEEILAIEDHSSLPVRELRNIATALARGKTVKRSEFVPRYVIQLLSSLFAPKKEADNESDNDAYSEAQESSPTLSIEDQLAGFYYDAASYVKNDFLARWFAFNRLLRNVLVIYTCRKLGWSPDDYIVGTGEMIDKLRTSKSKDFDLSEEEPLILNIVQIAEERDITKRERMIDVLRWQWLEEQTFARVFDIESVLTYYIRLGIIERWLNLDAEAGAQAFRELVMGLKAESNASLQEFKNNTSKR